MAAKSMLILIGLLVATHATMTAADVVCDTSQLVPCLPAAKPNPQPPTGQCCNLIHELTSDCLCAALQSPLAKVEGVDFLLALQLPHKCGRIVPKGTKCGDATVPSSFEHEEDHHEAMEHGMDDHESKEHLESAEPGMEHHEAMDHGMEHQEATEHSMNHQEATDSGHHDDHETLEQPEEEHQHAMKHGMERISEHHMENGMEH